MPSATREEQGDRSLLEIALDVHMNTTGSCEYHPDEVAEDTATLRKALQYWEETTFKKSKAFDEAVKKLIEATLYEAGEPPETRSPIKIIPMPSSYLVVDSKQVLGYIINDGGVYRFLEFMGVTIEDQKILTAIASRVNGLNE